jgi:hypothetical protein
LAVETTRRNIQEARKPLFMLRSADGAIGARQQSVRDAYGHFEALARRLMGVLGDQAAAGRQS